MLLAIFMLRFGSVNLVYLIKENISIFNVKNLRNNVSRRKYAKWDTKEGDPDWGTLKPGENEGDRFKRPEKVGKYSFTLVNIYIWCHFDLRRISDQCPIVKYSLLEK